nr:hypothetical protein [uncultured Chryseobacterium sp.]
MKIKLIIGVISLFSVFSFGQTMKNDYEMSVKKDFTVFFNSIKEKNIENAVNFVYPKYIAAIGREQMINVLNLSYNNPALVIDIQDFKVDHVVKPELIDGEYFSIMKYSFNMKFKVDWKVIHDAESVKQKIADTLAARYGKDRVAYFSDGDYYVINADRKACAISKDQKSWKFLILEKEYRPQLINILPGKIIEKL